MHIIHFHKEMAITSINKDIVDKIIGNVNTKYSKMNNYTQNSVRL